MIKQKIKQMMSKDARAERSEKSAFEAHGKVLQRGFSRNNSSAISKAKEKVASPDQFAKLFKQYVYNKGGLGLAEDYIDTFVYGRDYIKNMKSFQEMISDYTAYNMAMYFKDNNISVINRNMLSDVVLDKINEAAESFGYDPIYPMTDEAGNDLHDKNKVIYNPYVDPATLPINDDEKVLVSGIYAEERCKTSRSTSTEHDPADTEAPVEPANDQVVSQQPQEPTKAQDVKPQFIRPSAAEIDAKVQEAQKIANDQMAAEAKAAEEKKKESVVNLQENVNVFDTFNNFIDNFTESVKQASTEAGSVQKEGAKSTKSTAKSAKPKSTATDDVSANTTSAKSSSKSKSK